VWAGRRPPGRGLPGKDPIHVVVASIPYWQRRLRRFAAADRAVNNRRHRQHLRGTLVSGDSGWDYVYRRYASAAGDKAGQDMGRIDRETAIGSCGERLTQPVMQGERARHSFGDVRLSRG